MQAADLLDKLYRTNHLDFDETVYLIGHMGVQERADLIQKAHATRMKHYGNKVYMRGLIEFTNYCSKGCRYCGINAGNRIVERYRLSLDEILQCAEMGYSLGYRTFVLQGGEDPYFTDEILVEIIQRIKGKYQDTAITLSVGEKPYASYERYFKAGVDRYLLRHETASRELFEKIHVNTDYDNRMRCLQDLKDIGYQVGAGFMVGIPGQTQEDLAKDLIFLKKLNPEMVGIGPFIPHKETEYKDQPGGRLEDTITMIALTRLFLPKALLPSTTALGSIDPMGREKGLKAGANVVMPNLSPTGVREKYSLYDGKICTGDEAAECRNCIEKRIEAAGFAVDMSKGDYIDWRNQND